MREIKPCLTNDFVEKGINSGNIASHEAYEVNNYNELKKLIAKLSYANKDYILFFRGQKTDYLNKAYKSTFYPTLYRGNLQKKELKYRWEKLKAASDALTKKIKEHKIDIKLKKLIKWSILQHYEVTETPLIDVTQSLKVACSFAVLDNNDDYGYIFVFALPYYTNRISTNSEHNITNIRLISIAPPIALRPYFQEGFLIGEDEFDENETKNTSFDLNRRLVAKFRFKNTVDFWGNSEMKLPKEDLYPQNDPIEKICNEIKESDLFSELKSRGIAADELKHFMDCWIKIEKLLQQLPQSKQEETWVAPSTLMRYIKDKHLSLDLNKVRMQRNLLTHYQIDNNEIKKLFTPDMLDNIVERLNDYINNLNVNKA